MEEGVCGCVSVCVVSPQTCVFVLLYSGLLVSVSSAIISKRFHCGSGRFEPSGSEASKASNQTHSVCLIL